MLFLILLVVFKVQLQKQISNAQIGQDYRTISYGSGEDFTVTFKTPFKTIPNVYGTIYCEGGAEGLTFFIRKITPNSFTYKYYIPQGMTPTVVALYWFALLP